MGKKEKIIAICEIMDVPEIRAARQTKVFYFTLFFNAKKQKTVEHAVT